MTPQQELDESPQIRALGRIWEAQLSLSWNWIPDYPDYTETLEVIGSAGRLTVDLAQPFVRDGRSTLR